MRKTISVLSFSFLVFFLAFTSAKAECSYAKQSELNALASNIKYTVEPKTEEVYYPATEDKEETRLPVTTFDLQLFNITEEMKINVYNDFTKQTNSYSYENVQDGVLKINAGTGSAIVTFKVDIYGTGECGTTLLRTFEVKTPMTNPYRNYADCDAAPEYYLCQEYLTENVNFSFHEATAAVREYIKSKETKAQESQQKEKTFLEKLTSFLQKYWWISLIIIFVATVVAFVILKIRKERIV